jgi:hypothetical protein
MYFSAASRVDWAVEAALECHFRRRFRLFVSALRRLVSAAFVVISASSASWADASEQVLIKGDTTASGQYVTIADLEALGLQTISSRTPHDPSPVSYSGIWLKDFVSHFGTGDTAALKFTAIDFYEVTVTRQEWQSVDFFLATRIGDEFLEFENRGPMRVVMPNYDPNDKLHQELISKWIWMITEIELSD